MSFIIQVLFFCSDYKQCRFAMTANGLQLPEGGDFEALHCQPSRNFDRSTKLGLTTEPPLLGRCCYKLAFLSVEVVKSLSAVSFAVIVELRMGLFVSAVSSGFKNLRREGNFKK